VSVIALTGGGTAGHITPMLAVAEALRKKDPTVPLLVVGVAGGREGELVPAELADTISVGKLPFPRRLNADALRFPGRFLSSVRYLRREFRARSVDVLVGFGGYIAAPAYVAAWREKIPLVIHEANALPGLANRLGSLLTKDVAVCFPGTPIRHRRVVGMPLPAKIVEINRELLRPEAMEYFSLDPFRPVLLVTGGSTGARMLNEAIFRRISGIIERGWQILHLVGPGQYQSPPAPAGYVALDYCSRMDLAYSAADLVVSRAGAATVSELAIVGLPAIFVPYHVGNGEQEKNAQYLVSWGAARVVAQDEFTEQYIDSVLIPLLDDDEARKQMSSAAKKLGMTDGADSVADMVWAARVRKS
jgi:UDP-N-acetylglucosamine--N-acetylmuramyl-(pentapeptide) pyrophosphoryl-undecaprenol N-acetylglucosamine transferase